MDAIKRNPEIARALLSKRRAVAHGLIESARLYPRWKAAAEREGVESFAENNLAVFVDYMIKAFEEGNEDYLSLYAGEKLKQRYDRSVDQNVLAGIFAAELAKSRHVFYTNVADTISVEASAVLVETLNRIEKTLTSEAVKTLNVLWIADCIYLDIQAFLLQRAAEMRISLEIALVTTKNVSARIQEIQKLAGEKKFDVVFYSPLSYEFSLDFAQFQNAKSVLKNTFDKQQAVASAVQDIGLTLDCIVKNVECDVFVHNTSNLIRSENTLKDRVKFLATSRARKLSRDAVNARIAQLIEQCDQTAFGSVLLIDETLLAGKVGEWRASQYFHKSALQHPARLGALLAEVYADIIFVESWLKPVKVVVADLDNTLWSGVIGEGAVDHFLDRQKTLRLARTKGILLAINSKNDSKNVHWRGGILDDSDFVSKQINWDPKPQNMMLIQKELNLKFRNFLFLDDRAEEREMVQLSIPDVLCLDAESDDTWRRLALWANIAKNSGEIDRTEMYKQRAEREQFTNLEIDPGALMAQLGLEVRVREAKQQELPRVTELINRTSQFNCCDSRVTFREIQNRSKDGGWKIYIADARDRFGEMGIVSVLVARVGNEFVDIDAFVLSCRVFGYGMETAVLKRLAGDYKEVPIRGRIIETSVNDPCRNVYKDHGFSDEGNNVWLLHPKSEIILKPWLTVV